MVDREKLTGKEFAWPPDVCDPAVRAAVLRIQRAVGAAVTGEPWPLAFCSLAAQLCTGAVASGMPRETFLAFVTRVYDEAAVKLPPKAEG